MPTVSVRRDLLYEALGQTFEKSEDFGDLCFDFGLELDGEEVDSEGKTIFHLAIPANRYDLLCLEGIAIALSVFLGKKSTPVYSLSHPSTYQTVRVAKTVSGLRPYFQCAILRNVKFTQAAYDSFIDLQEKLHHNLCRKRVLASVGTHDLDTIQGPFSYEGLQSEEFSFVPLNQTKTVCGDGMVELLQEHQQLKQYLHLVEGKGRYPVVLDANRVVCSVPPIINSEHSKITLNTKNILFDVTALDPVRAQTVLNTLLFGFSIYCEDKFTIEPVCVKYDEDHEENGGQELLLPELETRTMSLSMEYLRGFIGLPDLNPAQVVQLLERMMIHAEYAEGENEHSTLICRIPPFRTDIFHPCDLAEDVAVAYGFEKLPATKQHLSKALFINDLTEKTAQTMALAGYHECQNWALLSNKETFDQMRRPRVHESPLSEEYLKSLKDRHYIINPAPIRVSNPKTREFEIGRTSLLPTMLKSLSSNQHLELPIKLFEIGDCMRLDKTNNVGSSNLRHAAALYAKASGSGLEEVHGLLDLLLGRFRMYGEYSEEAKSNPNVASFKLVEYDEPAFLPGRSVKIVTNKENICIGIMGVVHPDVLKAFSIPVPTSAVELSLEWLMTKALDLA